MEELTTVQTQLQTTVITVTQSQETTQNQTAGQSEEAPGTFPQMVNNEVHELFYTLGVDLDYVPSSDYECFTFGCQFVAALFFICFFLIYLFRIMSMFCGGKK